MRQLLNQLHAEIGGLLASRCRATEHTSEQPHDFVASHASVTWASYDINVTRCDRARCPYKQQSVFTPPQRAIMLTTILSALVLSGLANAASTPVKRDPAGVHRMKLKKLAHPASFDPGLQAVSLGQKYGAQTPMGDDLFHTQEVGVEGGHTVPLNSKCFVFIARHLSLINMWRPCSRLPQRTVLLRNHSGNTSPVVQGCA